MDINTRYDDADRLHRDVSTDHSEIWDRTRSVYATAKPKAPVQVVCADAWYHQAALADREPPARKYAI